MKRFFAENLSELIKVKSDSYMLPKDLDHRISSVLRMKDGDIFDLIDGNGLVVEAEYIKQKKPGFRIIKETVEKKKDKPDISLAVSVIRRERFELLIEKSVELGVSSIYPVYTDYSKPYGYESSEKLHERWQKIADQALSQCKRTFRCNVSQAMDLQKLLNWIHQKKQGQFDTTLVFHPGYETLKTEHIKNIGKKVLVLLGPEGGFSDNDIKTISLSANVKFYSLNTDILRTETAAFYALSVLSF